MRLVLKYRIGYGHESSEYGYLITDILTSCGVNAKTVKTDDEIIVFMEGDEEGIKNGFAALGERLPLSLYINSQHMEEAAVMPAMGSELKKSFYMGMYPVLMREIVDDSSSKALDIFSTLPGGARRLRIQGKEITNKEALKEGLESLANLIKERGRITVSKEGCRFAVGSLKSGLAFLTNLRPDTLNQLGFSQDDAITLSVMERPIVLKQGESGYAGAFFANDFASLSFCKAMSDNDISTLYISEDNGGDDVDFEYSGFSFDAPKREWILFSGADRFFVNQALTPSELSETEEGLFFDISADSDFAVSLLKKGVGAKKAAKAQFFDGDIESGLKSGFEFGGKLYENFASKYPNQAQKLKMLKCNKDTAVSSFFEALAALCDKSGFGEIAYSVSNSELSGGVKLDFILAKTEDGSVLDLKKSFASVLSYKLAGVEDDIILYSVFESIIDFFVIMTDEAKKSADIKKVFIVGDMLGVKPFTAKLKQKLKNVEIGMGLCKVPAELAPFEKLPF